MTSQIDFLPQSYRRQRHLRQARMWWMMMLLLMVAVTASTSLAQWNMRRSVVAQLAAIEPRRAVAIDHDTQLATLQKQLSETRELASLYTFLEHPWPRSRVLAAIVEPVPESVRIASLTFRAETQKIAEEEEVVSRSRKEKKTVVKHAPARIDLSKLHTLAMSQKHIVHLSGEAQNIAELHAFVDQLGQHPLIASASLKSLGAADLNANVQVARFDVELHLAPAYGMQGGPHEQSGRDGAIASWLMWPTRISFRTEGRHQ